MADEKTIEDLTSQFRQSSLLFIASIVAVVIIIGAAVFFSLQKSALGGQNERLDAEIISLNNEIQLLEGEKVEVARTAQQYLASISEEEILWSRVISRIQSLIPFDATTQRTKVNFLSYSGARGGELNLNGQSRPTQGDPFADVAEVISVFNESPFFANSVVPSITIGETDQGQKIASFIFNIQYEETAPEAAAPESLLGEEDPGISRQ